MARRAVYIAGAVFVLAAALRFLTPGLAQWARDMVGLEEKEGVYMDALDAISARISPKEKAPEAGTAVIEEAAVLGEFAPEPLHPAVAAFLARQVEYSDYPLPEHVDYGYYELPFAYAVPVAGCTPSGFGYRVHPILQEVKFHYGTDFAAEAGTDIVAFADGTVRFAGSSDSYGNYVAVDHAGGWSSLYAHCSYLYVHTGQEVKAGEKLALVGATGHVTGPHLHFELLHDGVYRNPEYYVRG